MIEKIQKYWSILICLLGLAGTFGVMQYRLDIQDQNIAKLEIKQNTTDIMLNDINKQLSEMNAKLSLIIEGKVTVKVAKE